ncbi:hypothetical protein [Aporhodopirellula aestuarii]|uniref:Uncharacterized protein n=1 Tax=Aporhodopirellula aestuarii TaxID=2950107 RepID=A0ABT0TZT5_9BACT|nr:hypothetical protein [Aporhodopirellula aestuarii]MCM2370128.1 hypothetical protein [Aporhodopirellula aestuarii]
MTVSLSPLASVHASTAPSLHAELKPGDLDSAIGILNLWGEQPNLRTRCENTELNQLGGPMLGAMPQQGARA